MLPTLYVIGCVTQLLFKIHTLQQQALSEQAFQSARSDLTQVSFGFQHNPELALELAPGSSLAQPCLQDVQGGQPKNEALTEAAIYPEMAIRQT